LKTALGDPGALDDHGVWLTAAVLDFLFHFFNSLLSLGL
jgi:hypothetical protein